MTNAQIKRSTWSHGDNYELWVNGEKVESWSTKDFTVNGFLVVFAEKHGVPKEEVEICEGVDDSVRRTAPSHQELLANMPPSGAVYDPRIESNDFDPEEMVGI